jgi:maleamate amidohydrolase
MRPFPRPPEKGKGRAMTLRRNAASPANPPGSAADGPQAERAHPGYRLPKGLIKPGLMVLDLMRLFCDPSSPALVPGFPRLEKRLFGLVDAMTSAGRPVVFTRHAHGADDDGGLIGRMYGRLQRAADPLTELISAARSRIPPAVEITKDRHSPFRDESTAAVFRGCDALLIAGVQTQACVLATAIDSARLGFVPMVVADACASKSIRLHRRALEVLASGHAFVLSADQAASLFGLGRPV